jgi:hypothetical protein
VLIPEEEREFWSAVGAWFNPLMYSRCGAEP